MAGAGKRVIAAFDFDETLITKDSLPDFLRNSFPLPIFAIKTFQSLPMLLQFKRHKITNDEAKERLLTTFLRGMSEQRFTQLCTAYLKRLQAITNPDALARVQWHQKRGDEVIIISASPLNWVRPFADEHNIKTVIATELEITDGKLTGKLATPNCHGPEKARRFLAVYPDRKNYELYMYGDGKSDQAMFAMADFVFERKFE